MKWLSILKEYHYEDSGPADWLRLKTNIILGLAWQYISPLVQHRLVVKTGSVQSYSPDGLPHAAPRVTQTTTSSRLVGLRGCCSSSIRNNWGGGVDLKNSLTLKDFFFFFYSCVTMGLWRETFSKTWASLSHTFQLICLKFLNSCLIVTSCNSPTPPFTAISAVTAAALMHRLR